MSSSGFPTRRTGLAAFAAALLSGCSATRLLDTVVPRGSYDGREGIAYGPHPRQRLDTFRPRDAAGPVPLVVFFYGGSWTRGERADYRFVGESLAAGGIASVVADYRLSPEVGWRDILADCAAATRWAFEQAPALGADPRRVFLMGHSAGGYNAAMLALDPRWLRTQGLAPARLAGWIGIAGAYDFLPIQDPEVQVAFGWPGTPPDSQPMVHASRSSPPALLLAGSRDTVVDPRRSTASLAGRLEAAGVPVRVRLLDDLNHATALAAMARPLSWLAPVRQEVLAFARGAPNGPG